MKKYIFKFLITLITFNLGFAQNLTIDYSSLNSNNCNVFGIPTTINSSTHRTLLGQPQCPLGILRLGSDWNLGTPKASSYQLSYNFKVNYRYKVIITAKTGSVPIATSLTLGFGNNSNITNFCNGLELMGGYAAGGFGSLSTIQINSGDFFADFTFDSYVISTPQNSLTVTPNAIFQINPSIQTVQISKIQIIEIPPPPSFTLSPSNLSISCGDISVRNFNVSPSNIPVGSVLSYSWNYNGWTNSTNSTINSINIYPSNAYVLPSSVSVTPFINGIPYPTLSCLVKRTLFTSSATLTGNSLACVGTNSNYTIADVGAGNNVSWSISNTSIATLNSQTQTSVNVTGVSNGIAVLTATITNSCGQPSTETLNINIGKPVLLNNNQYGGVIIGDLWLLKGFIPATALSFPAVSGASVSNAYSWTIVPDNTDFSLNCPLTGALQTKFSNGLQTITTSLPTTNIKAGNCTGNYIIKCVVGNACGSTETYITYLTVGPESTNPCKINTVASKNKKIIVTENPIKNGELNIKILNSSNLTAYNEETFVIDQDSTSNIIDGTQPCYKSWPKPAPTNLKSSLNAISKQIEVRIYDMFGKQVYYNTFEKTENITVKNLNSGKYILSLSDEDGTERKIIIVN